MKYHKSALPSFKEEKKWLAETYGSDFTNGFETFCELICEHIHSTPNPIHLVPMEELLNQEHSQWGHAWKTAKDKSALDRLNALLVTIKRRSPPFQLLAANLRLFVLQRCWLTLYVVIDVDHVDKHVVFNLIHWHGEDAADDS